LGRLQAAETTLAPLMGGAAPDPATALIVARLRAAQGSDEDAMKLLERACADAGDDIDILVAIGFQHLRAKRPAAAAPIFERIIGIDGESAQARTGLGVAWQRLGRNEDAVEQLMRSVALIHQQSLAHHALGLALLALGHVDWARRAFFNSLSFHEPNAEAHEKLADIYTQLDQRAVANRHSARAAALRQATVTG
jgi:Flp pilus assembly protein TadD